MGSEIVKGLIIQIPGLKTNQNNLSPSTSKPIEQRVFTKRTIKAEQRIRLKTPSEPNTGRLVEQRGGPSFESKSGIHLVPIEQREPAHTAEFTTKPVEQRRLATKETNVQQASVKTNIGKSKPIEQRGAISTDIDIEQFNFIELQFPSCGSVNNRSNSNIIWRIRDFGFDFNVSSLIFKVNSVEVQDSDSFLITDIGNGIQIDYNPSVDFILGTRVFIEMSIADTAVPPHTFSTRCFFDIAQDKRGPVFLNIVPCNQINVDSFSDVEFDVVDIGLGVDPDSIGIFVEGIAVCSGITLDPITIPGFGSGFHVVYSHPDVPFRYDSEVSLFLEAADVSESRNASSTLCTFRVEGSKAPIFVNTNPGPCDTFVDNKTGLYFEVYGVEHGVDISTLEVIVDRENRTVIVRPRLFRDL